MQPNELRDLLESPAHGEPWLRAHGLARPEIGFNDLVNLAETSLPLEMLGEIVAQLDLQLPRQSDPDRALANLAKFFSQSRSPLATAALLERDHSTLATLLTIFSASQHLSDLLIADPESFDLLRLTEGCPVARENLVAEIEADVQLVADDAHSAMNSLRTFKRRESLRIAYGDLIVGQPMDLVTRQLSILADALVSGAVSAAWKLLTKTRPVPAAASGGPPRFVALGFGPLGGNELSYSSEIEVLFLYDVGPAVSAEKEAAASDFFERLARLTVKLLSEATELGIAYQVHVLDRPGREAGFGVMESRAALRYYDTSGRTWERQAFVKARPVAGDLALGEEFLARLTPWIYRRYLSRADVTGIRALKHRIERRAMTHPDHPGDVRTDRGGTQDIELVVQFLQLLNGGDLLAVRTTNTLAAIARLAEAGCLTAQEQSLLEENYGMLRKIEHRLQIMSDGRTDRLPENPAEGRSLARRLGYSDAPQRDAWAGFQSDYQQRTKLTRSVLDRLLHDAVENDEESSPEGDLLLDPTPPGDQIREVLGKYEFADVEEAYRILADLAREKIRFLSTRRCRHFLAAIAPELLRAIAQTADPDFTLSNLATVSDSLGGKGVLWELFRFHPPSLKLYVDLCSSSETLSSLLRANPGMIDELLDSLMLDKLPTLESLRQNLGALFRGGDDWEPVLHRFKNGQVLRLGVRDILNKNSVEAISGTLSDIAQVIVEQIAAHEYALLVAKHGKPTIQSDAAAPRACPFALVAVGKFGGRELNYYSDLDLLLLYEAAGVTVPTQKGKPSGTSNQHFFTELGQRLIKAITTLGPHGRLYEIDPKLRPTGQSGLLATALSEVTAYFTAGQGQLWERQALCKARVIAADAAFAQQTLATIHAIVFGAPWCEEDTQAMRDRRAQLEAAAESDNLKRGPGGIADVEFLVQALQLRCGFSDPSVRLPGTIAALEALRHAGHLPHEQAERLLNNYRILRRIQARRRLMSSVAQDTLPHDPRELSRLASLLGYDSPTALQEDTAKCTAENRQLLSQLFPHAVAQGL
jgi:glutamate-ammonia-ligase adenylyltransferase